MIDPVPKFLLTSKRHLRGALLAFLIVIPWLLTLAAISPRLEVVSGPPAAGITIFSHSLVRLPTFGEPGRRTTQYHNYNMSQLSSIEWTKATWNPTRGCSKVSPGCKNCYAKTFAERWRGVPGHAYEFGFDLRLVPEKLGEPLKWAEPMEIFVNSMSDLFHEDIPDDYIVKVCDVMLAADWHTFQVLTKRPDRMANLLRGKLKKAAKATHILWGTSVEDRQYGVPRIGKLRQSGAKNLFLSIEPLLEDLGEIDLSGICWVIVGGESGPGARPIEASWVRSIRRQCRALKIPFFFKQWGGVRKKLTGRTLDNRLYDEFPAIKAAPALDKAERNRRLKALGLQSNNASKI